MSFPQPNADSAALNGQQYFRLNTLLASPGDLYESAQGALAFSLGPESDIARVRLSYFDDQAPAKTNETVIDSWRSFVGRVDARNEVTYPTSGRPGRILIWPDDLYDPTYTPSATVGFNPATDGVVNITPQLDVIQYFSPQQSLLSRRADKEYNSQSYDLGIALNWIVVPTYGRKYGFCEITNHDVATAITFKIIGVNYGYGSIFHQENVIFSGALPIGGQQIVNDFLGGTGFGMYDACVFTTFGDRMPMRIYLSDEA